MTAEKGVDMRSMYNNFIKIYSVILLLNFFPFFLSFIVIVRLELTVIL